jgi:hypothetical protein
MFPTSCGGFSFTVALAWRNPAVDVAALAIAPGRYIGC